MQDNEIQDSAQAVRSTRGRKENILPGEMEENLRKLKLSRRGLKGNLTRNLDELERLMNSSYNYEADEVRDKISNTSESMQRFRASHDAYHVLLESEHDVRESEFYLSQVEQRFTLIMSQLEGWLHELELRSRTVSLEISPEDSVSNVGSRSKSKSVCSKSSRGSTVISRRSTASSAANSRIKAAAKRAALEAKAASLKCFQDLEKEEFLLKQRKETLKIQTELAALEAEERVFSEAEGTIDKVTPSAHSTNYGVINKAETTKVNPLMQIISDNHQFKAISDNPEFRTISDNHEFKTISDNHQFKAISDNPEFRTISDNHEFKTISDNHEFKTISKSVMQSNQIDQGGQLSTSQCFKHLNPSQSAQQVLMSETERKLDAKSVQGPAKAFDWVQPQQQQQFMQMQNLQSNQMQLLLERQQQHTLALTLPQPEVPVFDGEPSDYCSFIRAFESLIEAKTMSPSSRLYYLVQYTRGDVQELMRSCLLMQPQEGYEEARRLLKSKYGQNHKIASAYINKVTDGPVIKVEDAAALRKFSVSLTSCKNTLRDIGLLNKIENPDTMQRIVARLPHSLKVKWRDEADKISEDIGREITIQDLANFVEKRARAATHPVFGNISDSRVKIENQIKSKSSSRQQKGSVFAVKVNEAAAKIEDKFPIDSTSYSAATVVKKPRCPLCDQYHWLSQCSKFKEKSLEERRSFVRSKSLCDNCLVTGHFAKSCEKKSFCRVEGCNSKHSTFLHPKTQTKPETKGQPAKDSIVNSVSTTGDSIGAGTSTFASSTIGLAIVPVKVRAKGQKSFVETYAFLDTGSNTTFCTEQLQKQLNIKGTNTKLKLTTLERADSEKVCSAVSLEVFDLNENNSVNLPVVYSTPKLPVTLDSMPRQADVEKWKHLEGVHLPCIEANVGLMIGCDVPKALEPLEFRNSEGNGPFATRTMFGWVVNGPVSKDKKHVIHTANFVRADDQLSKQFESFCNMEFNDSAFNTATSMSRNDAKAMEVFENSIQFSDGHYSVAIPWKNSPPNLPDNRTMALRRLSYIKKKLLRDQELCENYSAFMSDMMKKGYARRVPDEELAKNDGTVWYLPHHNVVHPQKPEKTRVVFDCAAKFKGTSLNDCVYQGPDLTNSLLGVLTRFRKEPIAFMADIESMFFQVRVLSEDVNSLRFLWYPDNDLNQDPVEYQMLVHLFGGIWSPSCANFALKKTAEDNRDRYDGEVADTIRKNFYVDDCLKSVFSEQRAVELARDLREMLASGGFNLSKWVSNSRKVLESVTLSERAKGVKNLDISKDNLPVERALGVGWDTETDQFVFKISIKDKPHTRRGLLSMVSSLFDPLGFVSPVCLQAKYILQELCRRKLDWDELIPEDLSVRWKEWLEELPRLEQFSVNRCFTPPEMSKVVKRELHHFSDASETGYGAVSYLRSIDSEGKIHCAVIQAKSRLSPMKKLTIPRLELAAAVLSSRLERMARVELDCEISKSVFWTDSTCVLGYLDNHDRRFQTYVANRVSAIMEVSEPSQWLYVDTKSNPADIASRGTSPDKLINDSCWKHGPDFLSKPESMWPNQPGSVRRIGENDVELKKENSSFATSAESEFDLSSVFQKFSSWYKLKKSVAWILRVKAYLRDEVAKKRTRSQAISKKNLQPLSVNELNIAEREILLYVQKQAFKQEFEEKTAAKKSSTKRSSSIYKLDPVKISGLLCVGGRLKNARINEQSKHQIILPKKHHIVDLIVRFYHELSGHSGIEYVLSLIRAKFWIVKGRVAVRRNLRRCFACKKRQAPVGQQKMADLPSDRVTPDKPPFSYVGVDCFGPFIVKRGRTQVKRYGVLYTCLAIRAIHLEVAFTLDTDSFINSLRRFLCRRGVPERMRSDNGSNFVSGEKELRESIEQWNQEKIHDFLLQKGIEWSFNPPAASHYGGVWERNIRTVRKVLKSVLKEQTLDDEALYTLFCEVEAIVNGRPITKASDDPRDSEALTPNHLLLLRSGPSLSPGTFKRNDVYARRRWRHVQYLANLFWHRWVKEYLPNLQQRAKWLAPRSNFKVNDIVLVVDENQPRGLWPLGRIVEVHQNSKDGLVRSVVVKTKTSFLQRPVTKLVQLETAD